MESSTSDQFALLVRRHAGNLMSRVQQTLDGAQDAPVEDWVMVHKVQKHLANGNSKRAAVYVACRLAAFPSKLSEWAQAKLRTTKLSSMQGDGISQILYVDSEGLPRAINFKRAV